MAEIINLPDNGGNSGVGNIPFSIPLGGGGGGILGGNNTIGELITLAIVASIFGIGNGGVLGGNGGAGGAGFLSNQINNDTGRELIMQAVTSQGEQSRAAVQTLSTMLGQDFNLVNTQIQGIQAALNQIAASQGMNALQVINAIQNGDAALSAQFSQCCCQNQLALSQLGNTVGQGFAGVQQSIAAKSAADQMALFQQTAALNETMNRNYSLLDNKIDALESNRKDREITALTAKVAQLESQNFTQAVIGQAIAPVNAQLAGLRADIDSVKCKLPETMTLPNTQFAIVPSWAANIGSDFVASYWANRLTQATAGAATGGGAATPATAAA